MTFRSIVSCGYETDRPDTCHRVTARDDHEGHQTQWLS